MRDETLYVANDGNFNEFRMLLQLGLVGSIVLRPHPGAEIADHNKEQHRP